MSTLELHDRLATPQLCWHQCRKNWWDVAPGCWSGRSGCLPLHGGLTSGWISFILHCGNHCLQLGCLFLWTVWWKRNRWNVRRVGSESLQPGLSFGKSVAGTTRARVVEPNVSSPSPRTFRLRQLHPNGKFLSGSLRLNQRPLQRPYLGRSRVSSLFENCECSFERTDPPLGNIDRDLWILTTLTMFPPTASLDKVERLVVVPCQLRRTDCALPWPTAPTLAGDRGSDASIQRELRPESTLSEACFVPGNGANTKMILKAKTSHAVLKQQVAWTEMAFSQSGPPLGAKSRPRTWTWC